MINTQSPTIETAIQQAADLLRTRYNCHLILLHGSLANGTGTAESDIDMVGFTSAEIIGKCLNDHSMIQGMELDAWIHKDEDISNPREFLHLSEARVLLDLKDQWPGFLEAVQGEIDRFEPLPPNEIDHRKKWSMKMLRRIRQDDPEALFRFHWLLTDSLENYFAARGLRYKGPKKSFEWLMKNDPLAHDLFTRAMAGSKDDESVKELIEYVFRDVG